MNDKIVAAYCDWMDKLNSRARPNPDAAFAAGYRAAEAALRAEPADLEPSAPLSHEAAIDALCGCAATVTVLSYQEAIEGYFKLRGLSVPS